MTAMAYEDLDIGAKRMVINDVIKAAQVANRLASALADWAAKLDAAAANGGPFPGPATASGAGTLPMLFAALGAAALEAFRDGADPYDAMRRADPELPEAEEIADSWIGQCLEMIRRIAVEAKVNDGMVLAEVDWIMGLGNTKAARDAATGGTS
jgi:urease gamma subunit